MRDRFSCFSESSVSFLQPSSSYTSHVSSSPSPSSSASPSLLPSVQNAVTSVYRTRPPSAQMPLYITLSWLRSLRPDHPSLTIGFGLDPNPLSSSSSSFKLISSSTRLFKKNKGSKSFELEKSHIEVFWDFSDARFSRELEPLDGFYVVVVIDSELGLFLGDMAEEAIEKKLKCCNQAASKFSLVLRQDHFSAGNAFYQTRCQFGQNGLEHDIVIQLSGESGGLNEDPVLSVYIDKKKVMRVKRLHWNFRGSKTLFIDGTDLTIDMLWDIHDWFFDQAREGRGHGVFMFTIRSGSLNERLWVKEEWKEKLGERLETDPRADDFSLFIYATKDS